MLPSSSDKTEGSLGQLLHWAWCGRTADVKEHGDQCELRVGEATGQALLNDLNTLMLPSSQDEPPASSQTISLGDELDEELLHQSLDESYSDVRSLLSLSSHGSSEVISVPDSDCTSVCSCKSYFTLANTTDCVSVCEDHTNHVELVADNLDTRYPSTQFAADRSGDRSDEEEVYLEEGWDGMVVWSGWIPRALSRQRLPHWHWQRSARGGPRVHSTSSPARVIQDRAPLEDRGRFSL